jgi:hypothetical protein
MVDHCGEVEVVTVTSERLRDLRIGAQEPCRVEESSETA